MLAGGADSSRTTLVDRMAGTLILVAAATNIVAGRSTAFMLPALVLMALALAYYERNSFRDFLRPAPASVPIALFLIFAVMSTAWSADPGATFVYTGLVLVTFFQWHVVNHWLSVQPVRRIHHLAYWFVIAVLIGLIVLLHEVFADQHIRRVLVEKFGILTPPTLYKHYRIDAAGNVHIESFELNRSIAALNMLLWPAVLCAVSCWSGWKFKAIAAALVIGTGLATMGSNHETSKLSLIAGALCFIFALHWRRAAAVSIASVWTVLTLGAVVAAHIAYDRLELHTAKWVQPSARERIVIWNDTADRVLSAPVIGAGARSAYVMSNKSKAEKTYVPVTRGGDTVSRHTHNIYLQNWFELGFVGAVLFLAAGLAILRALKDIPEHTRPYALATFAVFMMEIASSWEIWQRWFAALFALTMIYLSLAIRSAEAGPQPSGDESRQRELEAGRL
ncbi:O-antigen ligase family protein [Hyphomicrobium sp.]|uniref:O-antigen ligase family protein n=1 Tax=Hyphomicrobium sp. TaxID=82 RepID=UPI0025BB3030|nr:O-antigen ligase family protein [Hyphomicrobium sp.]MCC7252727.1 O-antigen ligase family protein [Hyphomicrobium sp.]